MVVLPHTSPIGLPCELHSLRKKRPVDSDHGLILRGAREGYDVPGAAAFRGEGGVGALREQIAMIPAEAQGFAGDVELDGAVTRVLAQAIDQRRPIARGLLVASSSASDGAPRSSRRAGCRDPPNRKPRARCLDRNPARRAKRSSAPAARGSSTFRRARWALETGGSSCRNTLSGEGSSTRSTNFVTACSYSPLGLIQLVWTLASCSAFCM